LREDLTQALARLQVERGEAWSPGLVPVTNLRAKHVRISTLQPLVGNRWLFFADHLPAEFTRQFREFVPVPNAGHDDAPDATEGAERVLEGLV
jgi:predicted phage terminase large subunit-like protein